MAGKRKTEDPQKHIEQYEHKDLCIKGKANERVSIQKTKTRFELHR